MQNRLADPKTASNNVCAGSGPCGASAATLRSVTPPAEHESRPILRFGNAGTLSDNGDGKEMTK